MGNFFSHLVSLKRPDVVVEFGSAFGVSGMYWLAGLESQGQGELVAFEPNGIWARIAGESFSRVSARYRLIVGTFEDEAERVLGNTRIDIAFIDAVHTSEFVLPQFERVLSMAARHAVIVLDDINFSKDMKEAWLCLAKDDRVRASVSVSERVGVIELL